MTLVLVCDKIYNMEQENLSFRPHLEEPEHISSAIERVMADLEKPAELERMLQDRLDRQSELFERHHWLRRQGRSLPSDEEKELDEINEAMLTLQHIYRKYHPVEE